jgi:glyoxylase-like metal-dependent hydrolase (beta-lactamase superfamily II)
VGARVERFGEDLYLIGLTPPIPGFTNFIGVWLHSGAPSFLVDVGPAATSDDLLEALGELGVDRLDYILLTHIHMDHAGGIGHVASRFSDARVAVHESGIGHLVDPTRLWAGTLKTLGDTGRAYGQILPVPAAQIMDAGRLSSEFVRPILTPGHAPHHVSYWTPSCLFAGEAGGVHFRFPSGKEYMRPATPPRFFLETALRSIDALLEEEPGRMCVGHLGLEEDGARLLRAHREQLLRWERLLSPLVDDFDDGVAVPRCLETVLRDDPLLTNLPALDKREQERERFFLTNSVRGFMGHIRGGRASPGPATE